MFVCLSVFISTAEIVCIPLSTLTDKFSIRVCFPLGLSPVFLYCCVLPQILISLPLYQKLDSTKQINGLKEACGAQALWAAAEEALQSAVMGLVLRLHSGETAEMGGPGDFRDPLRSLRTVWTGVCIRLSVYASICVPLCVNTHANWRIKG